MKKENTLTWMRRQKTCEPNERKREKGGRRRVTMNVEESERVWERETMATKGRETSMCAYWKRQNIEIAHITWLNVKLRFAQPELEIDRYSNAVVLSCWNGQCNLKTACNIFVVLLWCTMPCQLMKYHISTHTHTRKVSFRWAQRYP